jgi:hypothetical protein
MPLYVVNVAYIATSTLVIRKLRNIVYEGVKGTSVGSGPQSGHCREAMAPARVGLGMGQPIGVTVEGWWLRSDMSTAIFPRGDKCTIHSLFSPKSVCAW